MTRKLLAAAVCVAGLGLFGGPARAQEGMEKEKDTKAKTTELQTTPTSDQREVQLTVKKIDKSKHRLTFEAMVAPEANIEKNGQPIKLDQLKEGDSVRAAFDPTTGELIKMEVTRMGK